MNTKDYQDYLMDELWPLLSDEQKRQLVFVASMMAQLPEPDESDADTSDTDD